jgi:hypothetical protein
LHSAKSRLPAKITIKDAINGAPASWRADLVRTRWVDQLMYLTPVLFAVKVSLEVASGDDWSPTFSHSAGFSAEYPFNPLHLAYQVFLEGILHRAWK